MSHTTDQPRSSSRRELARGRARRRASRSPRSELFHSERLTYLGTGIADLDAAKKYLRNKFRSTPLEPIVCRPGARFYVSVRRGGRSALLLGPYVSHMTALANVSRARRLAAERGVDLTFAAVGTASTMDTRATVYGR